MDYPESQDPQDGPPDPADPQSAAPGIDWESDENPYRQRFNDYRTKVADPKITRLSQYEQAVQDFQSGDPAEMRRAAAVLGINDYLEIEDPDPPTYDDPTDELAAKYAALEEKFNGLQRDLTAKEQKAQEDAQIAAINAGLDRLGIPASDKRRRSVVLGTAYSLELTPEGLPDLEAAVKALEDDYTERFNSYKGSKKSAPRSIQPGQTGTGQKSAAEMTDSSGLLTQEGLDYYAQRMEDMA